MKRTAVILGIAAAMGVVPSVAAAGSTAQQKPQFKPQVVVQILKPQPVSTARHTVARVSAHRFSPQRVSLSHISSR